MLQGINRAQKRTSLQCKNSSTLTTVTRSRLHNQARQGRLSGTASIGRTSSLLRFTTSSVHQHARQPPIIVTRTIRGFSSLPEYQELGLPALSPTMTTGNLSKWKKKEGDKFSPGESIAEIETDKATVDFEATEEGYLAKILVEEGTKDIPIGTTIAISVEKKEDVAAFKDFKPAAPSKPQPPKEEPPKAEEAAPPPPPPPAAGAPPPSPAPEPAIQGRWVPGAPPPPGPLPAGAASPRARAVAASMGVNLSGIVGTGPNGRIIQADVEEQASRAAAAPRVDTGAPYTDLPVSQIRKVIANRLTESKQTIPHYYLTVDCNVDKLLKLRAELNEKGKGEYKLSVNDFIIKASALALQKVPEANSSWMGDTIRRYHTVDINIAVNTDRGLITPLIKDADKLGLVGINENVKFLAEKAKENKLSLAQLASGTFTISNLGMFGIKSFSAVINPPQACILAVGTTEQRVVVDESALGRQENDFKIANYISVTLSCDHRVVDGAVGAQWLAKFKEYIEDPTRMLL